MQEDEEREDESDDQSSLAEDSAECPAVCDADTALNALKFLIDKNVCNESRFADILTFVPLFDSLKDTD